MFVNKYFNISSKVKWLFYRKFVSSFKCQYYNTYSKSKQSKKISINIFQMKQEELRNGFFVETCSK